jgi:hypothetical protein
MSFSMINFEVTKIVDVVQIHTTLQPYSEICLRFERKKSVEF